MANYHKRGGGGSASLNFAGGGSVEFRNKIVADLPKAGLFMERWIERDLRKDVAKNAGGSGKKQRRLSKRYAKQKTVSGALPKPNFQLTGDLMSSLGPFPSKRGGGFIVVEVGAHGRENQRKAMFMAFKGRVLFDLPQKDVRRLAKALAKSGHLITNEKGRGSRRA